MSRVWALGSGADAMESAQVVAIACYQHQYLLEPILAEPNAVSAETATAMAAMCYQITVRSSPLVLTHALDWDRHANALPTGSDSCNPVGAGTAKPLRP